MSGYLRVQRDRFGHKLFRASKTNPFCRGYAWDWMVAQACWRATTYDIRGKTVTVDRGQFVASPDEMAMAWGWARTSVQRFLSRLQTDHMIGQETGHNKTIITICNYDKYQTDTSESGQESGRNIGHKAGTKRAAKERREEGEEKEEGKRGRVRAAETELPPEWIPNESNVADAEARGFSQQEISDEADRFRDHHLARGNRMRNWDAAWRTWLGNARKFANGRVAGGPVPGGRGPGGSLASIAAWRRASGAV
jgi:hypothetical protein